MMTLNEICAWLRGGYTCKPNEFPMSVHTIEQIVEIAWRSAKAGWSLEKTMAKIREGNAILFEKR